MKYDLRSARRFGPICVPSRLRVIAYYHVGIWGHRPLPSGDQCAAKLWPYWCQEHARQQSLFDTALAQVKTLNRLNFAYDTSFNLFGLVKYQYITKESRGLSPLGISMENMTKVIKNSFVSMNGSMKNFSPRLGVLKCGVMGIMRFDHRRLPRHRLHLDLRSMQQRRPFHPFQC